MATTLPIPCLSFGRPPTFRPPGTTFSPDPEGDDGEYLVHRYSLMTADLERMSLQADRDPSDVLKATEETAKAIGKLLDDERMLQPVVLPPGLGILYSLDEILAPESDAVGKCLALIDRVEALRDRLRREVAFKRMFDAWDEPEFPERSSE